MLQTPSRKFNSVSDNTKRIIAGISKSVLPQKIVEASLPNKISLLDALASGKFTPDKFGLYKEADKGADLGKIWVKKTIKEADGTEKDWLVVYTNDEDEIIRQLASATLQENMLQKTAAPKQPNPKDIPIAPGIKSKNITMDQSGGAGTAKVTVEFTDTDQALKFYQDQGEPDQKVAPVQEEKPAEGQEGGEKPPANIQAGNVPPVPPTPQQGAPAGPRMTSLKPTIQTMSRFGQQVVYVIKKEAEEKEEDKKEEDKKEDEKEEANEKEASYSFINEQQQEIILPWKNALRVGSMFERPDTGTAIRLAGYIEQKLTPIANLVDELVVIAGKPYFCETCDTGFSEGQMNFHKNHTYKKKDGEDKEEKGEESSPAMKADKEEDRSKREEKEASQRTADIPSGPLKPYPKFPPRPGSPNSQCRLGYCEKEELGYSGGGEETLAKIRKGICPICGSLFGTQKTAADISDEVPPMGWDSSKGQAPSNAGPSLPPQQNLQDQNKPQDKGNVLYDSNQDSGPQFQTTINPKDKSVSIKFIDSVEQEALQQAVNKPAPALTQPQQAPAQPQPQQGQGQAGAQPNQSFQQQEVPVTF
jgi:hypothetical protein